MRGLAARLQGPLYKFFKLTALSMLLFTRTPQDAFAGPPPVPGEQYTLMDFNDSVLHDAAWRDSLQPAGTVMPYVSPKGDSGSNTLQLGVGKGRNGTHALEVVSDSSAQGLPGFWVLMGKPGGGNVGGYDGYMLPRGKRANRVEFWIKFEKGYRAQSAAAQPPEYPNHQNLHFGTYHHDPSGTDWSRRLVETDNWHFYYQLWLRHDKAQDGWIHVVLHESPNHQRSESGSTPNCNTTRPAGNFWEILTRFYIDGVSYFSDPQKPYPVKMWVDDIVFSYVDKPQDIEVDIENNLPGHKRRVSKGSARDFDVKLSNNTQTAVSGQLTSSMHYSLNPSIIDPASGQAISAQMTLNPGEVRSVRLRVNPDTGISDGFERYAGLSFVPDDQFQSDSTSKNRSFSDSNIERRWQPSKGPYDGIMYCDHLELKMEPPLSNAPPESLGGVTCEVKQGGSLQAQLNGLDPDGNVLNFQITKQPGQGSIVLDSSTGAFTYTPSSSIQKYDYFWYSVGDGQTASRDKVVWIVESNREGCGLSPLPQPDSLRPNSPSKFRLN